MHNGIDIVNFGFGYIDSSVYLINFAMSFPQEEFVKVVGVDSPSTNRK